MQVEFQLKSVSIHKHIGPPTIIKLTPLTNPPLGQQHGAPTQSSVKLSTVTTILIANQARPDPKLS